MQNIYGLIGKTLSHSFSKRYFTEKFEKESITNSIYELFEIPNIEEFPKLISQYPNLRGLNVTIPYKEAVIPFLDGLDERAKRIGAVNVIQFSKSTLIGFNSDYIGFKASLEKFIPHTRLKALILGTGGASKAVKTALEDLQIPYLYVSRQKSDGVLSYEDLDKEIIKDYLLIINTTPLGMYPKTDTFPAIPYEWINSNHYLYDLVYNPEKTLFLQKGEEKGAKILGGLQMLYLQAEGAWRIWQETIKNV
ncbi:MAG: shikimate dehydrogenase [Flammeovirgaceae bacterium]